MIINYSFYQNINVCVKFVLDTIDNMFNLKTFQRLIIQHRILRTVLVYINGRVSYYVVIFENISHYYNFFIESFNKDVLNPKALGYILVFKFEF